MLDTEFRKLFPLSHFAALAFANNSDEQKGRKNILKKFTFPHAHSDLGTKLDQLCMEECQHLVQYIRKSMTQNHSKIRIDMKPLVAKACANIFNRYNQETYNLGLQNPN